MASDTAPTIPARDGKGPRAANTYRGARRNFWRHTFGRRKPQGPWPTKHTRVVPYLQKPPVLRRLRGLNGMPLLFPNGQPRLYVFNKPQPKSYPYSSKRQNTRVLRQHLKAADDLQRAS